MSPRKSHDGQPARPFTTSLRKGANSLLAVVGPALGTLFFIPHPVIGVLVWGAFAMNPRHALFALLGLAVGEALGLLLRTKDEIHLGGDIRTNALLAGAAVSWLTWAVPDLPLYTQLGMAVCAAASAAVFAAVMERALGRTGLPGLVWPYCVVAGLLFMLFPGWTGAAAAAMHPWPVPLDLPGWGQCFLHSLGALLFSPGPVAGAVVAAATLIWSRTMFVTGLLGWVSGVVAALVFMGLGLEFAWAPVSYNFYLAGMALGAVFFLPGRAALVMAVLGGVAASFFALALQHALPASSIPYLPISASLTIWLGIGALARPTGQSVLWRNHTPWLPPEDAWWRAAHWYGRFGRNEPLFALPVAGPLLVAQGFGGELSHVGPWRHALDFQSPEDVPEGDAIWGMPVTAPAGGVVERIRANVADNPVGVSNFAENWGNHIVLRLDQGGYAMLAHLRRDSCAVTAGSRVETGTYLAAAGNSGRSPVPHLHLQAQSAPDPGAPTIPFRMANYLSERVAVGRLTHWHDADVPLAGDVIMAAPPNAAVHEILASMAPGMAVWTIETEGLIPAAFRQRGEAGSVRVNTRLDEAGRHILSVRGEGALVSVLAPDAWRIIEPHKAAAPILRLLSLAAPAVPYAAFAGLTWDDAAPLMPTGMTAWAKLSLLPYMREPFPRVRCLCRSAPAVAEAAVFEIETHIQTPPPGLPHRLVSRFDLLRGPVYVEAEFLKGKVAFSLMSFEPGLPLDTEGEQYA